MNNLFYMFQTLQIRHCIFKIISYRFFILSTQQRVQSYFLERKSLNMKSYIIIFTIVCLQVVAVKILQSKCSYHALQDVNLGNLYSENDVCNKSYTITYITLPPYYNLFRIEDSVLEKCCGKCVSYTLNNRSVSKGKINRIIHENRPDFVFPVLHRYSANKFCDYYFIPVVRVPSFIYITPMPESSFSLAVRGCFQLYPLLLVCLLMSLVAGFVIWCMETRTNKGAFPRSFFIGWIRGIWWSTVTFVSTGLEKTPKSLGGRIFSVIWIAIGVTMLGLLTSSLTTMMVRVPTTPKMKGKIVGTLLYRQYDEYMIAKHGGIAKHFPNSKFGQQFYTLIHEYHKGNIDALLFDRHLLAFALGNANHHIKNKNAHRDLRYTLSSDHTETIDDSDLSYGILVKESKVYKYFCDAIKENWLHYETIFTTYANEQIARNYKKYVVKIRNSRLAPVFSPSDPYVYFVMASIGGVIVLISIVGIVYQWKCYDKKSYSIDISEIELPTAQVGERS